MNWYLIKLVYQVICGEGDHTAQFDEQLRLVKANNERDAITKGKEIGYQKQESFYNNKQEKVSWEFIDIIEVHPLQLVESGAEVCSQIREVDDAEVYINFVHYKAGRISENLPADTNQS
jgi:hypothetical protein